MASFSPLPLVHIAPSHSSAFPLLHSQLKLSIPTSLEQSSSPFWFRSMIPPELRLSSASQGILSISAEAGIIGLARIGPKLGFGGICGAVQPRWVCGVKGGASQPRGPLWKGRNISKEGVQAVQDLKRARDDVHSMNRVLETRIARLLKADILEVLNELQRQNEWFLALKIFHVIRKESWYKPDVYMYRNMMDNLGRNKQIEEVHTLFKISQEEGLKPDLVLFTELLGAYLRANMPRLAVDIYEEMKQLGHQPNQLIYTILVKGLRRSGESLLASSVMAEFSKAFPEAAKELEAPKEVEAPKELVFPD